MVAPRDDDDADSVATEREALVVMTGVRCLDQSGARARVLRFHFQSARRRWSATAAAAPPSQIG